MEGTFEKVDILIKHTTTTNMTCVGVNKRSFGRCNLSLHHGNLLITTYDNVVATTKIFSLGEIDAIQTHPAVYNNDNDPPEMEDE